MRPSARNSSPDNLDRFTILALMLIPSRFEQLHFARIHSLECNRSYRETLAEVATLPLQILPRLYRRRFRVIRYCPKAGESQPTLELYLSKIDITGHVVSPEVGNLQHAA